MNSLASECSSGCESGWTMYLDNSSVSDYPCKSGQFGEEYEQKIAKDENEAEEDLSMVSDASSGPPHFHEHEDYCNENGSFCSPSSVVKSLKKSNKRQKIKQQQQQQQYFSLMDDTASSPIYSFSKARKICIAEAFWFLEVLFAWKKNSSRTSSLQKRKWEWVMVTSPISSTAAAADGEMHGWVREREAMF
ncbi:hypothetical protein BVC80_459g7 [Macleaya cordata]|uniref:Uncharacterized protein n=1 Tax=Macleaya cordata TaxID=56857 RepID=A0A200Q0J6_MACCD|nr:hypothetical protein BVC80_459g7 [Macleaya cordata]